MRTQVIYYLFHPSPDYTTDEAGGRLVIAALSAGVFTLWPTGARIT